MSQQNQQLVTDRGHLHAALAARESLPQAPVRMRTCPGCGRYHYSTHPGVCVACKRPRC